MTAENRTEGPGYCRVCKQTFTVWPHVCPLSSNERDLLQRSLELLRAFHHAYEPSTQFPLITDLERCLARPADETQARRCLAMTDEFGTQVCSLPESHGGAHVWVTPETKANPFDAAAISANPGPRRISMSFQTQEQYEAALVFLDMADSQVKTSGEPGA